MTIVDEWDSARMPKEEFSRPIQVSMVLPVSFASRVPLIGFATPQTDSLRDYSDGALVDLQHALEGILLQRACLFDAHVILRRSDLSGSTLDVS